MNTAVDALLMNITSMTTSSTTVDGIVDSTDTTELKVLSEKKIFLGIIRYFLESGHET